LASDKQESLVEASNPTSIQAKEMNRESAGSYTWDLLTLSGIARWALLG